MVIEGASWNGATSLGSSRTTSQADSLVTTWEPLTPIPWSGLVWSGHEPMIASTHALQAWRLTRGTRLGMLRTYPQPMLSDRVRSCHRTTLAKATCLA